MGTATLEGIAEELIEAVRDRLASDKRVRRTLPAGGRLHVDRPLPFLVVHRPPERGDDAGTRQLILGQASYLATPDDPGLEGEVRRLLRPVIEIGSERFGAFLLVELWADPTGDDAEAPTFQVVTPDQQTDPDAVDSLVESLGRIEIDGATAEVTHIRAKTAAPPGREPLLEPGEANRLSCFTLGIEVSPIYRSGRSEALYPELLRDLAARLGVALREAFYAFARDRLPTRPTSHHGLGRRAFVRAARDVDTELAEICGSFDFLHAVTPVNTTSAWERFCEERGKREPSFRYRQLTADPEILLRRLYAVPLEEIEDPTLDRIYREKIRELARQLTMLAERSTHRFLHGSLQLYGEVEEDLLELARRLLEVTPAGRSERGPTVEAAEFARLARDELDAYRSEAAGFDPEVEICSDISGLMVAGGRLLIDESLRLPRSRARALIEHEVGTHLLTWANGGAQPLKVLRSGLAGYEALQEGLAVLGEYLVGGLTRGRIRLLAARVIAAERAVRRLPFTAIYDELTAEHGFGGRPAFTTAMRACRGGGLTKDVIYLRGLEGLVRYLQEGGDIELLYLGKFALQHVAFIDELLQRGVLQQPPLRPHCLRDPRATERLEAIREGRTLVELAESDL